MTRDEMAGLRPATGWDDGRKGFEWCRFSRGELHLYNIRHIQHHAAQLSMRLRLDAKAQVPWVGTGWKDLEKK